MNTIETLRAQQSLATQYAHEAGSVTSVHSWVWLKPLKLGAKMAVLGGSLYWAKSAHPDFLEWMHTDYSFLSVSANQLEHTHIIPESLGEFCDELPMLGLSMAAWAGFCYIRSIDYENHAAAIGTQIKALETR